MFYIDIIVPKPIDDTGHNLKASLSRWHDVTCIKHDVLQEDGDISIVYDQKKYIEYNIFVSRREAKLLMDYIRQCYPDLLK